MRYILTLTLLITLFTCKSQTNQVGIGLIELNSYHQKIANEDTSITSKTNSTLYLKPIISFNHTNKKDLDFSLQLGYFPEQSKINQKSVYADKSINYSYSHNTKQTVYCKLGIAKRINLDKFYFLLGVQMPFSVNYKNYNETKNTINDSVGKFIQLQTTTNNLPNTYYTGILINIGTFYKLYKNIYIGGEINYGIYYSLQFGNRTYTTNNNNSLGIISSDSKQLKYNQSQFQLLLNPTIHLRFELPKGKITKYLILILSFTIGKGWNTYLTAQTVTIPDANFAACLQTIVPSAMTGNLLDTTNVFVTTTTKTIDVNSQNISNLYGVQFFKSLTQLTAYTNSLTTLPQLSNAVETLVIYNNKIASLPKLPDSLKILNIEGNSLIGLPTLPINLKALGVNNNSLTGLPTLPNTLKLLHCGNNHLFNLPTLPDSLIFLICNNNSLSILPQLPDRLWSLSCSSNLLSVLPPLPVYLIGLACYNNKITNLPTLPKSLRWFNCDQNNLSSLPLLPDSLQNFSCSSNNINCFSSFPNTLFYISIYNNPVSCLPNYVDAMDTTTKKIPLCVSDEECPYNGVVIPNIFTPNNDGVNDNFFIKGKYVSSSTMYIVNRWGKLVCNSKNAFTGWDGISRETNAIADDGVYFYIIEITLSTGKTHLFKGTITLVK